MKRRTLPLWMVFGLALGLALGPVVDSLGLRGTGRTAWAAAGVTTDKWPTAVAAGYTFSTVVSGRVYNDTTACTTANTSNDASNANAQTVTYKTFDFTAAAIPANSTIDGITVTLVANLSGPTTNVHTMTLQLVGAGGTPVGSAKTVPPTGGLTTTKTVYTAGGADDTWAAGLAQSDMVSTNFGVKVTSNITGAGTARDTRLYCLNVKVNYNDSFVISKDGTNFSTTVSGALSVAGLNKGQSVYGGRISVKNAHPNTSTTYTVAAANPTNNNATFKDANNTQVIADGTLYDTNGATAGQEGAGLNITAPRTLNASQTEHLCYYFSLPSNTDNAAMGGQVTFDLTFSG